MITTKKLIACWAALGIILVAGNVAYDVLKKEAVVIAAKEAPPYVPVSDGEAVRLDYETCTHDPSYELMLLKAGSSCQEYFSQPMEKIAESAQKSHRYSYDAREVESRVNARQSELRKNLEMFYYALIIAASAAFLFWAKSTVLPRLIAMKDAVRERAPSADDLKTLGANRKMRKVESDFAALKSLHDNDMISDEMFEKRKEELKASLGTNSAFRD